MLPSSGWRIHEDIPTSAPKGNKATLVQNMGTEKHNKKAVWINIMENELKAFEEGRKAKIHFHSQIATLKNVPNRKTPDHGSLRWYEF